MKAEVSLPIPVFCDDFAILVAREDPTQLVAKAEKAFSAVATTSVVHGMTVNDAPGKTEAIIEFHWPGAKERSAYHERHGPPIMKAESPLYRQLAVATVTSYKHPGFINQGHTRYVVKARARAAQSYAADSRFAERSSVTPSHH